MFRTVDSHGYAVEFSPFRDGLLAVGSSQHFGIVGNGRLSILQQQQQLPPPPLQQPPGSLASSPMGSLQMVKYFETQDGIFDISWSECNEFQIVVSCGDGSIKLFDMNSRDGYPLQNYKEHTAECSSVDWNIVKKDSFITSSWDKTAKLWDPLSNRSVRTFAEHSGSLYNAQWSPRHWNIFSTCSQDGSIKIWDVAAPRSVATVVAHAGEVLAIDWNKYHDNIIATGGTDRAVLLWDLRNPMRPLVTLKGHDYGIRRLKCSPHDANVIASCS